MDTSSPKKRCGSRGLQGTSNSSAPLLKLNPAAHSAERKYSVVPKTEEEEPLLRLLSPSPAVSVRSRALPSWRRNPWSSNLLGICNHQEERSKNRNIKKDAYEHKTIHKRLTSTVGLVS